MFPQDPCIIYIEKECKVQVSVLWLCADCMLAIHICVCFQGGGRLEVDLRKMSPKMTSRA